MAESFGADPERYDRARPRYPDAMVERIVAASPGPDVLDVGCGTGIAARQFQAAGCTVLGVEPDARMADFARRSGLEVEVATFEDWDPAGRTFDAVVAGQAWHWVDPVAGAAKAARGAAARRPAGGVLARVPASARRGGGLRRGLPPGGARLAVRLPADGRPALDAYQALYTKAADGIREAGGFGDPEQWRFDWERSYTRDEWLDLLPTSGGHTRLPPAEREEVLAGIGAAVDAVGGSFTMHFTRWWSPRRPG